MADDKHLALKLVRLAYDNKGLRKPLLGILKEEGWLDHLATKTSKEKWIPKDLERGRCTPGSPNYDCPPGSPQYNLMMTFKKHPEWGEKGRRTQQKKRKKTK